MKTRRLTAGKAMEGKDVQGGKDGRNSEWQKEDRKEQGEGRPEEGTIRKGTAHLTKAAGKAGFRMKKHRGCS